MKPRFIPDPQDSSGGILNSALADLYTNFLPSAADDSASPLAEAPSPIMPVSSHSSRSAVPGGQNGGDDDIAAAMPDGTVTGQTSHPVPDAAASEDSHGIITTAGWSEPATPESAAEDSGGVTITVSSSQPSTSETVPADLANPAIGAIVAHGPQAGGSYDGTIGAPAHADYQMSHVGLHTAAPADNVSFATAAGSLDLATAELAPFVMTS